jgi:hypothetical protein
MAASQSVIEERLCLMLQVRSEVDRDLMRASRMDTYSVNLDDLQDELKCQSKQSSAGIKAIEAELRMMSLTLTNLTNENTSIASLVAADREHIENRLAFLQDGVDENMHVLKEEIVGIEWINQRGGEDDLNIINSKVDGHTTLQMNVRTLFNKCGQLEDNMKGLEICVDRLNNDLAILHNVKLGMQLDDKLRIPLPRSSSSQVINPVADLSKISNTTRPSGSPIPTTDSSYRVDTKMEIVHQSQLKERCSKDICLHGLHDDKSLATEDKEEDDIREVTMTHHQPIDADDIASEFDESLNGGHIMIGDGEDSSVGELIPAETEDENGSGTELIPDEADSEVLIDYDKVPFSMEEGLGDVKEGGNEERLDTRSLVQAPSGWTTGSAVLIPALRISSIDSLESDLSQQIPPSPLPPDNLMAAHSMRKSFALTPDKPPTISIGTLIFGASASDLRTEYDTIRISGGQGVDEISLLKKILTESNVSVPSQDKSLVHGDLPNKSYIPSDIADGQSHPNDSEKGCRWSPHSARGERSESTSKLTTNLLHRYTDLFISNDIDLTERSGMEESAGSSRRSVVDNDAIADERNQHNDDMRRSSAYSLGEIINSETYDYHPLERRKSPTARETQIDTSIKHAYPFAGNGTKDRSGNNGRIDVETLSKAPLSDFEEDFDEFSGYDLIIPDDDHLLLKLTDELFAMRTSLSLDVKGITTDDSEPIDATRGNKSSLIQHGIISSVQKSMTNIMTETLRSDSNRDMKDVFPEETNGREEDSDGMRLSGESLIQPVPIKDRVGANLLKELPPHNHGLHVQLPPVNTKCVPSLQNFP